MSEKEMKALQEELEQYRKEKEKIKSIIGSIGGKTLSKYDRIFNVLFITFLVVFFVLDILRHFFNVETSLPPLFSLEIGLLLVSIKIIWMIHKQTKVEHFQFWILNSIEFRVNDVSKKIKKIEKHLKSEQ
ncbi:MAG: hypothetical protein PF638_01180 [Candidatus Delongbacteria bacterium]|jgi:hypothetical protein|nr:hypothetical protein [Candidatus Delongbacteria bacterium]